MWSLGIVLYAMCFSSLPFHDDDPRLLKKMICRFVEERRQPAGSQGNQGTPLLEGGDLAEAAASWLPPDLGGTRARARGGRLGPLRLVLAALLNFDAVRRP